MLDWGLARIATAIEPASAVSTVPADGETRAGELLGTPGYMSPEQARGETVEPATDIYALGCILFEILVGRPALSPGTAGIAETLTADSHRPSDHAANIDPELDDLCARATAADASDRPTARELADRIQAFLDGDRDVSRRRELAEDHARRAAEAATNPDDESRGLAMHEAGRALALDPSNPDAQTILGRLLLAAPRTIPSEALASADQERGETRQKNLKFAGYGYLAALPAIGICFLLPIHHVWPIVALLVLAITTGVACLMLSRDVLPMRTPWMVVLVALNCSLLMVLGLIFSPLMIMPIFLIGSLAGVLQQPSAYSAWIGVVAHALPLVLLLALEAIGALPSTFEVGAGGLVFTLWVIELTPAATVILFGLAFVTQSALIAGVTVIGKRTAESAQNHLHAIAWHLRQMLPRANDRSDTTGRAAANQR